MKSQCTISIGSLKALAIHKDLAYCVYLDFCNGLKRIMAHYTHVLLPFMGFLKASKYVKFNLC